jgi:hypothetical protein
MLASVLFDCTGQFDPCLVEVSVVYLSRVGTGKTEKDLGPKICS